MGRPAGAEGDFGFWHYKDVAPMAPTPQPTLNNFKRPLQNQRSGSSAESRILI
jgi:hypothetical protein